MKDKEKQIEEMFQDVAKVMCDCEDKKKFFRPHRYGCRNCYMHTVIQHIVFFLRNSDYEKLPENSVVLSKEELEKEKLKLFAKSYNQGSKETAEKILEKIIDSFWMNRNNRYALKLWLKEQFGIEIKE